MSKERAAQLVDAGVWLRLSGDLDGARRLFERALKLDPSNEKAKQLLAAPAAEVPEGMPLPDTANPFERGSTRSALEREWTVATGPEGTRTPAPFHSSNSVLDEDWGQLAGVGAPGPQVAPEIPAVTPSGPAVPPPPAYASSLPPAATLQFAMPSEVREAQAQRSSPSGTMVFAMPDEVKAALGDAPPGATDRFYAMPAFPAAKRNDDADFQELADEAPEVSPVPSHTPQARVVSPDAGGAGPPVRSTRSGTMVAFAMPDEVKAALGQGTSTSPPLAVGAPPPVSSPSGTMVFAAPPEVRAALSPLSDDEEFAKLADDVEEIPLLSSGPSRVAPLSKPSAPKPAAAPPPNSADLASDDWGQLTVEPAREPGAGTFAASPSSAALPPPPAFFSSPSQSGSTQQFAMPKEVRGALSSPPPETVVLRGDAPPPDPPKATPPLYPLSGDAPPVAPSMFTPPPHPMGAFNPELLPARLEPVPDAPVENAWQWKGSSSLPQPTSEEVPVPRPSPTLDPAARSAWDLRSAPGINLEPVAGADRALDLLTSGSKIQRDPTKAREDEIATILRGARDLLDLDDHTGAMELIKKAEKLAPDSPEVRQLKDRSERTLLAMFESRLGHLDRVPRVLLKDDEIIWLNLDHRAGFILAQIDGTVTFDDLFAVSGMSRLDTARILAQLVDEGVISRG